MCLNPECNLESVGMYCSKRCKRRARTLRERMERDLHKVKCPMCGIQFWSDTHKSYGFCKNCRVKILAKSLDCVSMDFARA